MISYLSLTFPSEPCLILTPRITMSSSFFYSQDHDCSVCSPSLHPTPLTPSLMSAWEDISSVIDLYWDDGPVIEEQSSAKARPSPRTPAGSQISDNSIASTPATGMISPTLLSSSASTITSTSSSPSTSSSFSRRFRLKKAISHLSLRRKPSGHDPAPRSAQSLDGRTPVSHFLPPTSYPAEEEARACGVDNAIHPYNFFEASLYMGD